MGGQANIYINQFVFRGSITPSDLLNETVTIGIPVKREFVKQDVLLFSLTSSDYALELRFEKGNIILKRNEYQTSISAEVSLEPPYRKILVSWTPTFLQVGWGFKGCDPDKYKSSIITSMTIPPKSIIKYAKEMKLLPSFAFSSSEDLRNSVYEALSNLQDVIRNRGAYDLFWDFPHDGKKLGVPVPKREINIHNAIPLLLDEWALLRAIEIIPENKTGIGNIDFSFLGTVEGIGPESVCVEVKFAHAADLIHGLEVQLPEYMKIKSAKYGAYVVFWFKGDWFNKPTVNTIRRIEERIGFVGDDMSPDLSRFDFAIPSLALSNPALHNIWIFIINVTKPTPASKV